MPAATASSTMYWMAGLSTMGSISLGMAFVAGAQACRGDDGFTDLLHGKHSPLVFSFLQPYRAGKT